VGHRAPAKLAGGLNGRVAGCAAARVALAVAAIASLALVISACGRDKSAGLGERVIPLGQPVPKGGGRYMVGEPYDIAGVKYSPREDPSYDRTGRASWYGELFHGRRTANGEIYDMDRLSAAHPTLPLPVYAQVTNLKNGRSVVVRVNDRGPFANDRIIDLSRRSADVLGFRRQGTVPVRVRYLRRAPLSGDDSYERQYLAGRGYGQFAANAKPERGVQDPFAVASIPGGSHPPLPDRAARPVTTAALPEPAPGPSSVEATILDWQAEVKGSPEATGSVPVAAAAPRRPAVPRGGPAIQAGSFKSKENADRARTVLSAIAPVDVAAVDVGGVTFFRVRVGPFANEIEAAAALPRVTAAGYDGARIVMRN
jgi:rare lipoprotein A